MEASTSTEWVRPFTVKVIAMFLSLGCCGAEISGILGGLERSRKGGDARSCRGARIRFSRASEAATSGSAAPATLWALGTGVGLTLALFALEHVVAVLLVPETSRAMVHPAWIVCAVTMPLNALAFVSDGIHKGAADFSFLRNAMLASTGAGLVALAVIGPHGTLVEVWWATALWIAMRTTLGVFRIWPGLGHAPLRGYG